MVMGGTKKSMMKKEELWTRVREMLAGEIQTIDYYFERYPGLKAEREVLHKAIIQTILERKDYSKDKRIYMLGGAPANGKSAFIRSGIVKYPNDILKIDPDEIKMMLPEYRYMLDMQEPRAAGVVHEESSELAKKIRERAIAEGTNLLLDGVNNESIEKRIEDVKALKCNGHWVRIDYVTLDTDLSLWLAKIRYQRTGRLVPEDIIKRRARSLVKLIPELIELQLFDELYLWDTNIAAEPRLILRQKSGKLVIVDKMLYENFKRKADEEQKEQHDL